MDECLEELVVEQNQQSVFKFFLEIADVRDIAKFCEETGYRMDILSNENFRLFKEIWYE